MQISQAIEKMVLFCNGNAHDVAHFLKVWGYARTIGLQEGLDDTTQQTLELAAIVHDIGIPICREKYGHAQGPYQEREGIPLAEEFYREFDLPQQTVARIAYLVGHHHTLQAVQGLDYRILLEADFLVNADEGQRSPAAVREYRNAVFETATGIKLLNSIYQVD